jgi:hypothetical protein
LATKKKPGAVMGVVALVHLIDPFIIGCCSLAVGMILFTLQPNDIEIGGSGWKDQRLETPTLIAVGISGVDASLASNGNAFHQAGP